VEARTASETLGRETTMAEPKTAEEAIAQARKERPDPTDYTQVVLERIPLTFEHSPRGERSFCILVG
jgi:hypothetical protein